MKEERALATLSVSLAVIDASVVAEARGNEEMVRMPDTSNSLEAIRLISDWGKWLVTIETAAIAIIGSALLNTDRSAVPKVAKVFATLAISSFLISIVGAAALLLTLPEIAQNVRADQNIWLTEDSVAGRLLGINTEGFALVESVFFGFGLILLVGMIVVMIWSRALPPGGELRNVGEDSAKHIGH